MTEYTCDDCGAPEAEDVGHAILCPTCKSLDEYDGPSEYECQKAERSQMGITG